MTDGAVFRSVPDSAKCSGVSKDHLYFLCRTGKIEYFMIGKKYMIHYPHLMEYLEQEAKAGQGS